jgi:hypothetical protein
VAFSLVTTEKSVNLHLDRLERILADMPATALSRYALAEIVLIRAAFIFEEAVANLAYKLACGAPFPTGAPDGVLVHSNSLAAARMSMRMQGGIRIIPKDQLKWTRVRYISQSVAGVLDPASHYLSTCTKFGVTIAEIFEVRNHAAHKSSSTRRNYLKWVKNQYGQERNLQLGYFLLTQNLSPVANINRYITSIRVIVHDIAAGP